MFLALTVFLLTIHALCVNSTCDVGSKMFLAGIKASALSSCERFINADFQFRLTELIPEIKNILSDVKCNQKASNTDSLVENKQNTADLVDLLRELKSERCKENNLALKNCQRDLSSSQFIVEKLKKALQKENISVSTVADKNPKNCAEIFALGDTTSGVRVVYPYILLPSKPVIVFCDQATDGGGWTLIQNRDKLPIREDFYRNWTDYKTGFGETYGEFWLGLDHIRALTTSANMELRVDLEDYEEAGRFATYKVFRIGDESSLYKLTVGQLYSGTAGDSLARHNGKKFSTYDKDNDDTSDVNCAVERHGAWWYTDCNDSNLNGFPYVRSESLNYHGIQWDAFHSEYYSLKKASMKVRPNAAYNEIKSTW